jgi:hypothetical protein
MAAQKFVSQQHYNAWLERQRYVGRHLRAKPNFE